MTGNVSGEADYQAIALGLVQLALNDFTANHRGYDLGNTTYRFNAAKRQLLHDDQEQLIIDGSSWISRQVLAITPKTSLDHPFMFRVIANGDLLIGIDERDLTCHPKY